MRILRMTATFGKLEHETLNLKPGLNIIEAPNEWGKSTWCAFLMAMLYGLDTRERSTKNTLADKERYAPWSGLPMSGTMEILWQGRNITIQRSTRGRIPMGIFQAFETESGIPVPELTAETCGRVLLGVEQSVFRRAGFIRFQDLPVTADEALRRRLHDLVTTGDETGEADHLEQALRELKHKCRYKRSGLLPQAEAEREQLKTRLDELNTLEKQLQGLQQRLQEESLWEKQLENHLQALSFSHNRMVQEKAETLERENRQAAAYLAQLEAICARMPTQSEAEHKLQLLRELQAEESRVVQQQRQLPVPPEKPAEQLPFAGLSAESAMEMAKNDVATWQAARRKGAVWPYLLMLFLSLGAAAVLALTRQLPWAAAASAVSLLLVLTAAIKQAGLRKSKGFYHAKYGTMDTRVWQENAARHGAGQKQWQLDMLTYRRQRGELDIHLDALQTRRQSLCGSQSPEALTELWQQVIEKRREEMGAREHLARQELALQALQGMVRQVSPPAQEDSLTCSQQDTTQMLIEVREEKRRLEHRMGQYQGRMEALGRREAVEAALAQVNQRIEKLEETYSALELAQETLQEARIQLQRRFAPRITGCAQQFLSRLTEGRYNRLALGQDFRLQAAAQDEDVLREIMRRSDGTVDQIYLALRLAVAQVLTPDAPLVLDDALVRFDDKRLKAAMDVLQEMAGKKQVILFTCQNREKRILDS